MTGDFSVNKKSYGSLWNEAESGRTGNDIASSVMRVLDAISKENSNDPNHK